VGINSSITQIIS